MSVPAGAHPWFYHCDPRRSCVLFHTVLFCAHKGLMMTTTTLMMKSISILRQTAQLFDVFNILEPCGMRLTFRRNSQLEIVVSVIFPAKYSLETRLRRDAYVVAHAPHHLVCASDAVQHARRRRRRDRRAVRLRQLDLDRLAEMLIRRLILSLHHPDGILRVQCGIHCTIPPGSAH